MGDPYIGEIRMFAGLFAPVNWNFCDGSVISIAENTALYQLLGTTYGGDGVTTFALPDLRSRVPVHQGNGYAIGQVAGAENVTLISTQLPQHTHSLFAATSGQVQVPTNATIPASVFSSQLSSYVYGPAPPAVSLASGSVGIDGGSQPHANLQPYLAIYYIIAMQGTFPSPQ